MRYERPSTPDGTEHRDVRRDESESASDRPRDERELYGEPCHEVDAGRDEQTLYGEPQHETRRPDEELDPDLLFATLRAASFAGPSASASGESTAASATER